MNIEKIIEVCYDGKKNEKRSMIGRFLNLR